MKSALISMVFFAAIVMILAIIKGPETVSAGVKASGSQLLKFAPILVVALVIAGFAEVLIPSNFVEQWLSSSSGFKGILIAWLAGIVTPGGSIVGMPLIAAMYSTGAGVGVLVTYASSMALSSFVKLPMEIAFYGWKFAAIRVGATILLPPLAGAAAVLIDKAAVKLTLSL